MGISISGSLAVGAVSPGTNASTGGGQASAPPVRVQAATKAQVSESEQVVQLYNQGQQVSQIASSLALPVETVNLYLGISGGG